MLVEFEGQTPTPLFLGLCIRSIRAVNPSPQPPTSFVLHFFYRLSFFWLDSRGFVRPNFVKCRYERRDDPFYEVRVLLPHSTFPWYVHPGSRMTRSHVLLHCPNERLRNARAEAWEGREPGGVHVLLSNPRWERRILSFLELSGLGRTVADGIEGLGSGHGWVDSVGDRGDCGGSTDLISFPFLPSLC